MRPEVTVIVPVYNGAATLDRCLSAIAASRGVGWTCIVVDDGSTDDSAEIAARRGARVLRGERPRSGPGQARNLAARAATSPLLCFVDADVVIRSDTLARFVDLFEADPSIVAAFGSYDADPVHPDLFSQYRNLLHHFVHQTGRESTSTFWAGCGMVRRDIFLDHGGFDPAYTRPSIEDIELGYRLRAAGLEIRLARHIQVMHLKRWTLGSILVTDIRDRALPWTRLIRRTGVLPNDLNVGWSSRLSSAAVYGLVGMLLLGCRWPAAWLPTPVPLAVLLACNRDLYTFFLRHRGLRFTLCALPLHWLYYAYSAAVFAGGMLIGPPTRPGAGRRITVPAHAAN